MFRVLIATSNAGKLRDFAAAAALHGIEIAPVPRFRDLPEVVEDGETFEDNAVKKAVYYSRHAPGEIVLADDSGLAVDALGGAPGVRSARYAARSEHGNSTDAENNAKLLGDIAAVPDEARTARFVCVVAAARDGQVLATFRGEAEGHLLHAPRGHNGFGYDPLFFFPALGKTFAQLSAEEKAGVSHRGKAFWKFLEWFRGTSSK
jgi:XTP/dITP diphosphohydrolase